MAVLPHDQILRLHTAIIDVRLSDSRNALLAGIAPGFVAGLWLAPTSSQQILSDLVALNSVERLADGTVPLKFWLDNALALAAQRVEADVIRTALDTTKSREADLQVCTERAVLQVRTERSSRAPGVSIPGIVRSRPAAGILVAFITCLIFGFVLSTPKSPTDDRRPKSQILAWLLSLGCVDMKIDDVLVSRFSDHATFDVRLRNHGGRTANVTRVRILPLPPPPPDAPREVPAKAKAPSSASYEIVINNLDKDIPVSHVIRPDDIDRFEISVDGVPPAAHFAGVLKVLFNGQCECQRVFRSVPASADKQDTTLHP